MTFIKENTICKKVDLFIDYKRLFGRGGNFFLYQFL